MPSDLASRHQILWDTLSGLYTNNPERAAQAVNASGDPELAKLLQRVRQLQAEQDRTE